MADENPQESAKLFIVDYDNQYFSNTLAKDFAFFINSEKKMVIGPYNKGNPSILELHQTNATIHGPLEVNGTLFPSNIETSSTNTDLLKSKTANVENVNATQIVSSNIDTKLLNVSSLESTSNEMKNVSASHIITDDFHSQKAIIRNGFLSNLDANKCKITEANFEENYVDQLNASNIFANSISAHSDLSIGGNSTLSNVIASNVHVNGNIETDSFLSFHTNDSIINDSNTSLSNEKNDEFNFYWGNIDNNGIRFQKTLGGNLNILSENENKILELTSKGLLDIKDVTVKGTLSLYNDINYISDIREKNNVRKIENALQKLSHIHGYSFTMKNDPSQKKRCGVIAQELLETIPESVYKNDVDMYSVSYNSIIGVLIESIHELNNRIKILEMIKKPKHD